MTTFDTAIFLPRELERISAIAANPRRKDLLLRLHASCISPPDSCLSTLSRGGPRVFIGADFRSDVMPLHKKQLQTCACSRTQILVLGTLPSRPAPVMVTVPPPRQRQTLTFREIDKTERCCRHCSSNKS